MFQGNFAAATASAVASSSPRSVPRESRWKRIVSTVTEWSPRSKMLSTNFDQANQSDVGHHPMTTDATTLSIDSDDHTPNIRTTRSARRRIHDDETLQDRNMRTRQSLKQSNEARSAARLSGSPDSAEGERFSHRRCRNKPRLLKHTSPDHETERQKSSVHGILETSRTLRKRKLRSCSEMPYDRSIGMEEDENPDDNFQIEIQEDCSSHSIEHQPISTSKSNKQSRSQDPPEPPHVLRKEPQSATPANSGRPVAECDSQFADDSAWIDVVVPLYEDELVAAKRIRLNIIANEKIRRQRQQEQPGKYSADETVDLSPILLPDRRTLQHKILDRLGQECYRCANSHDHGDNHHAISKQSTKSDLPPISTATEQACSQCLVALKCVRVRMAAGMVKAGFKCILDLLEKGYEEAAKLVVRCNSTTMSNYDIGDNEADMKLLNILRERLSGLWCIYVHYFAEISDLIKQKQQQKCHGSDGGDTATISRQIDDYVETVLLAARACPLVGNHSWTVLALGRYRMTKLALQHDPMPTSSLVTIKHADVQDVISSSIAACWDAMDDCCRGICNGSHQPGAGVDATLRRPRRSTMSQQQRRHASCRQEMDEIVHGIALCLDQFHVIESRLGKEPRMSLEEIQRCLSRTVGLSKKFAEQVKPKSRLSGGVSTLTSHIFMDRNSIRDLSLELNRWSRLGEHLHTKQLLGQQITLLRPIQSTSMSHSTTCNLLDELPLFQFIKLVRKFSDSRVVKGATIDLGAARPIEPPYGWFCDSVEYACKTCQACFQSSLEMQCHTLQTPCGKEKNTVGEKSSHHKANKAALVLWKWQ